MILQHHIWESKQINTPQNQRTFRCGWPECLMRHVILRQFVLWEQIVSLLQPYACLNVTPVCVYEIILFICDAFIYFYSYMYLPLIRFLPSLNWVCRCQLLLCCSKSCSRLLELQCKGCVFDYLDLICRLSVWMSVLLFVGYFYLLIVWCVHERSLSLCVSQASFL